jgi:NAD(P)-dependent dehydrogenase (short-subunit alcohol dehydrogenase family)
MIENLKGKTCVITGGGGVIGSSIAFGLAKLGVNCAIVDINLEAANSLASQISTQSATNCIGVQANVLDKTSLINAKNEINNKLGIIDILINGAGGNSPKATTANDWIDEDNISDLDKSFFGLDIEGFQKVFDLNFIGTILPTMVFTKDMVNVRQGVVLNVSSMNSFRPLTRIPAYSAAKASINNFTEWLAVHMAKTGVRVNAVAPGFFLTNQNRFLLTEPDTGKLTARGNKIIANTPMGKFGEPNDLIGTVVYLLSDMSKFVTGVVIPVDGGFNAYSGV